MPKCYVKLPTTIAAVPSPQYHKHQHAKIISIIKLYMKLVYL